MALSFGAVEKAYEVFNEIEQKHLPELSIGAFPEDVMSWSDEDFEKIQPNRVFGYDKKSDSGWENLFFFTPNPTQELKDCFESLKNSVPNSSTSRFDEFVGMWKFGWF